jgi:hypothetical protein
MKIKNLITVMGLAGLLFIASGCSEIEPVSPNPVDEPELYMTRADGSSVYLLPGTILSAVAADYFSGSITGPTSTIVGVTGRYSIPPIPSGSGILFTNWTISPNNFTASTSMSRSPLDVKFDSPNTYTVQANFTVSPNGGGYIRKTVQVIPLIPTTPAIYEDYSYGGYTHARVYVAYPKSGESYEWSINMNDQVVFSGTEYIIPYSTFVGSVIVRCRAKAGSQVSPWSNGLSVLHPDMAPLSGVAADEEDAAVAEDAVVEE